MEMIKSPSTEERSDNSVDSGGIKDGVEENKITKTTVDFFVMEQSFKITITLKIFVIASNGIGHLTTKLN